MNYHGGEKNSKTFSTLVIGLIPKLDKERKLLDNSLNNREASSNKILLAN